MNNLVEEVNKTISKWDMQIAVDDILNNGKSAIVIKGETSIRDKIDSTEKKYKTFSELIKEFEEYDIVPIDHSDNYPSYLRLDSFEDSYYDCRDWAFDKVGLSHLTFREGLCKANKLLEKNLPGISWIPSPEKGAIVVYFVVSYWGSQVFKSVKHWGVVSEVNKRVNVESKWGHGHVYSHPLEMSPIRYGNSTYFFRRT